MEGIAAHSYWSLCCAKLRPNLPLLQGISKLEGKMQRLRGLITAYASVVQSLKNAAAADPSKCANFLVE